MAHCAHIARNFSGRVAKSHIGFNVERQNHLDRQQTIHLGSFYTPSHIVQIVSRMLSSAIENPREYILLDSACGYGSFLQLQGFKRNIGVDIDEQALVCAANHLREYQNQLTQPPLLLHKNALHHVCRDNFKILETENLVIVGNPPYNDRTSIVQNRLKNKEVCNIDSGLKARDIGLSFLLSFSELQADFICILHPLSYLIKPSNFRKLKNFVQHYRLIDSVLISSATFCPKSHSFFPIIIALYQKDVQGMDYHFIQNYHFKTLNGQSFCLNDFDFIAHYIDKYPNKKRALESQKIAMFYTMRDINALRRSKTFITKDCANAVYVSHDKYSLYCYVDVFKMMLAHVPYYLGNCDIPIDCPSFKKLESLFIIASETKKLSHEVREYFQNLLGEHYQQ